MFTLALQSHDKTKSRDQIMFATCKDGPIRFFQNPYDRVRYRWFPSLLDEGRTKSNLTVVQELTLAVLTRHYLDWYTAVLIAQSQARGALST